MLVVDDVDNKVKTYKWTFNLIKRFYYKCTDKLLFIFKFYISILEESSRLMTDMIMCCPLEILETNLNKDLSHKVVYSMSIKIL